MTRIVTYNKREEGSGLALVVLEYGRLEDFIYELEERYIISIVKKPEF